MIDESDKVKDLLRWWMHTWESRDLILNQFTAITSPNPDTHGFSMDDMKSAIPDTVGKLEALRHESIDKYEWPTFTNSKANSLVVEIKQKAENIFALHLETLRLNRAHFFPEAYPDTINDMDKQTRDFINNNNKLTNYVIQESKQGDRKLHELMQLYRINISEQEAHTVTDHSHDMQEISNSAELFMKKPVDVSAYWAGIITGIVGMAFCAAIFIICITFLHFDFLKSPFWWCLFFLAGLSIFLESFGTREMPYNKDAARAWARAGLKGYGGPGPIMLALGKVIGPITIILAFIFFWWQGGVAIIVSGIIWFISVMPLIKVIEVISKTTPFYSPNHRLKH